MVIGILSLLAALYLTAISKAKAKGLQTQCASNLRQLGMALEQFVSDNHAYPFVQESLNSPSGLPELPKDWHVALGRYAGGYRLNTNRKPYQSAGLFHCPAANPPVCPTFPEGIVYTDYGYNAFGVSRIFDRKGSLGLSPFMSTTGDSLSVAAFEVNGPVAESQIASPADMMAIGDGFTGNSRIIADASGTLWRTSFLSQDWPPGSTGRAYARHKKKENVVFCDGHIEVPLLQTLFGDNSDSTLSRWNRDNQPHRERLTP